MAEGAAQRRLEIGGLDDGGDVRVRAQHPGLAGTGAERGGDGGVERRHPHRRGDGPSGRVGGGAVGPAGEQDEQPLPSERAQAVGRVGTGPPTVRNVTLRTLNVRSVTLLTRWGRARHPRHVRHQHPRAGRRHLAAGGAAAERAGRVRRGER